MSDSESEAPLSPTPGSPVTGDQPSQICAGCSEVNREATVECLACRASYCSLCSTLHLQSASTRHHRLIPLSPLPLCPKHHQETPLYCFTCKSACCLVCSEFSKLHRKHDICDWEGAAGRVQGECGQVLGKLGDMKKMLDVKIGKYEGQKKDVERRHRELKERLKNTVKDLVKTLDTILDEKIEALETTYNPTLTTLNTDLSLLSTHQKSISALSLPYDKSSRLGKFLPLAQSFLETTSAPGFYPTLPKVPSFKADSCKAGLELFADIWTYGTRLSLDNRWECRMCRNKNFPKSSQCRKCGQTNRLLQRLLSPKAA